MLVMMIMTLILTAFDIYMTAWIFVKLCVPSEEELNEKRVEEAQKREREEERDKIDEGFENIMRFSVNGRDGFDIER